MIWEIEFIWEARLLGLREGLHTRGLVIDARDSISGSSLLRLITS